MMTAFAVCGGLAVLFAVIALFQRTLYGAAMCLLGVLMETAALFMLVGARLLGFLQILVYAGAVMVLIVIAILASPPRLAERWGELTPPRWLGALAPLAALAGLLAAAHAAPAGWTVPAAGPAVEQGMARVLFGVWAPLTEAVGVLVLVASLAVVREP